MRRFLFASVAASGLALAALPAFAQLTTPVPVSPPTVAAPAPSAGVSAEERTGNAVQTPEASANVTGEATATTSVPPIAETTTQAEAQADAPEAIPAAPTPRVAAQTPAPSVTAQAATPAQAVEAAAGGATPTPVNAAAVCQPRTTSVHFGARGSALSQQNRNAIEYAVDSASVCSLQSVVIADSGTGGVSSRRAAAVRSTLIHQGVPAGRISVEHAADADASTGELAVRMQFAGLSGGGPAMAQATQATPESAPQTPPATDPSGQ